jgi:hypothetical protein
LFGTALIFQYICTSNRVAARWIQQDHTTFLSGTNIISKVNINAIYNDHVLPPLSIPLKQTSSYLDHAKLAMQKMRAKEKNTKTNQHIIFLDKGPKKHKSVK